MQEAKKLKWVGIGQITVIVTILLCASKNVFKEHGLWKN